ncbi:PREDICTED: pre-rRNA-processing protein ESF1 [Nelumbo nucifera]|uniref:Pre-rRNA-processing protein ESF1 n=1 Tax=Nelumbo nucifera TaxID=4432 RepID=A0A1U8AG38_NELNU|nr:PREDICTED: pre-rRNA-processing protein ESF1 [Nelumbo nucifera]
MLESSVLYRSKLHHEREMESKNKTSENGKKKKQKNRNEENKDEAATPAVAGAQDNDNHGRKKVITDARFSSVHFDPRFQKVPKNQAKVSIDSRFNRMFSDKRFTSSSARVDKRGKLKSETSGNPLRHYYRFEEEDKAKREDDEESEESDNGDLQKPSQASSDSESSSDSELSKSSEESESDTSSSTSDTDDRDRILSDDEKELTIQEENIPVIEKETHRLAVLNMDWSQVKAVDLYVVLSSFLPKGGQILSVAVYPSEFGLKRMEEEAVHGPVSLFGNDKEQSDDDDDEIDNEKLRAYEMSRLRYYYAVVECDSSATADYLYKACDGVEFERSSNVLDLRFIPDSVEFKHPPRDIATEAPTNYQGLDFHTRALQQSKVHLSWDEDEPQRLKTLRRKLNDDQLADLELKEYLASDDDETDDDENNESMDGDSKKKLDKRDMYRALVHSGDGSDEDGEEDDKDMEVTFNTGLEDLSKRILEKKDNKSETVWEAYLRKQREKKAARKKNSKYSSGDESSDSDQEVPEQPDDFFVEEPSVHGKKAVRSKNPQKEKQQQETYKEQEVSQAELELLLADDQTTEHNLKGYNLKPKKAKGKKGKKAKDVPMEGKLPSVDYDDPRFSQLFTSPLFALDPTDPQFKRSAAYIRQLAQKNKKGDHEDVADKGPEEKQTQMPSDSMSIEQARSDNVSLKKEKHELSSLVRSVKKKSQQTQMQTKDKKTKKEQKLQSDSMCRKREKPELSELVRSLEKKRRN